MPAFTDTGRTYRVLLVDDSPAEAYILKDCLRFCAVPIQVDVVDDGQACLAFLRKEGPYQAAATPDLILSDFNLPGISAFDLLKEIVADSAFCDLPVVIMTSWDREQDVIEMYRLRCSGFVVKPTNPDALEKKIRGLCDYWFSVVDLPCRNTVTDS